MATFVHMVGQMGLATSKDNEAMSKTKQSSDIPTPRFEHRWIKLNWIWIELNLFHITGVHTIMNKHTNRIVIATNYIFKIYIINITMCYDICTLMWGNSVARDLSYHCPVMVIEHISIREMEYTIIIII